MFYLYILLSQKTGKFYIGSTENITDRLERHNGGRSKATASGIPWEMVYTETFETRSEAVRREMEIKSWKSHARVARLVSASRI